MPAYRGVEVWMEDSEHRKINHQEVKIDLVDDRTVIVKAEMLRNELYTVHCLSPVSVFCDVFVITASPSRKRAARFHLDKSLAISNSAYGSSVDHTEGQYRDDGLRTSKRKTKHGKVGTMEVEIRRIGEIVKGEPREECSEAVTTEFSMIDDFSQLPWLVFHFDISVKESSPASLASAAEHIRRPVPHRMVESQSHATSQSRPRNASEEGSEYLYNPRKRPRVHDGRDRSPTVGESSMRANSDQLHEEYQREEAEEQRLMQKLQERLQIKKARNMELRRLLGETP